MREAVIDSNVLFAFRSARDQYHDQATAIVDGMDAGDLPRGVVTNYTLPEVLNPILKRADTTTRWTRSVFSLKAVVSGSVS